MNILLRYDLQHYTGGNNVTTITAFGNKNKTKHQNNKSIRADMIAILFKKKVYQAKVRIAHFCKSIQLKNVVHYNQINHHIWTERILKMIIMHQINMCAFNFIRLP